MSLNKLQLKLEHIYRLDPNPQVELFVISTDEARTYVPDQKSPGPQVLVKEKDGEVSLAVHVGDRALERIEKQGLEKCSLADFCSAAEEVSHFTYLAWSAHNERPVSLLDVEIQGEIDKYLLASAYYERISDLFQSMFERVKYERKKTSEETHRYREANRLAGKFCRALNACGEPLARLREFYRLASPARLSQLATL